MKQQIEIYNILKILIFLIVLVQTSFAQQKRIAIMNTVDDGEPPVGNSELTYLTDRLREIASKTLPQKNYAVMTQQSIVAFLGSQESMAKECRESEGCLANLGKRIDADYIGQGRIGRFGTDLTIKVELYESKNGNLVSSFTGQSKNTQGLLSVLNEKAPDLFKRLPGVSSSVVGSSTYPGGIGGVQTAGGNYEFSGEKSYLVNISTEPKGAVLSFDGVPNSRCTQTPCKVELAEGSVRIMANLEQYEISDTTVSVTHNNQSIAIKLKPNFGVLEIKPAYSDGIGKNERWNLFINDKNYYSLENRLNPGRYKVELIHECYEALSFNAGINKGGQETFDMANHIKLKMGGLVLKAEKDGEPVSEPVYVNGKREGETPFSGSVPVCAEIEIGSNRDKVYVALKHNEKVTHTHKIQEQHDSYDFLSSVGTIKDSYDHSNAATNKQYDNYDYSNATTNEQDDSYDYSGIITPSSPFEDEAQKTIQSMFNKSLNVIPIGGVGYQRIWDMHHIWLDLAFLYATIGMSGGLDDYYEDNEKQEVELIVGLIHRWVIIPNNSIKKSFGLFGGLGTRTITVHHCPYHSGGTCDVQEVKKEELQKNMRHELGIELILGYISLQISERNFERIGVGIGLIFWWNREEQKVEW